MKKELRQLARFHGIEPSYDANGGRQNASDDALRAILAILGIPAQTDSEVRDSLRASIEGAWQRIIEPVSVIWLEDAPKIRLRLPTPSARAAIACELRAESGECTALSLRSSECAVIQEQKLGKNSFSVLECALPKLPIGYYSLSLQTKAGAGESMLIVAPRTSYTNPGITRSWGLFLPVYAAHSETSWGGGNLSDYSRLSKWVRRHGGAFLGSVPILAAFLEDWCCEPSPYAPASRLFWNEFFIDLNAIPDLAECKEARRLIGSHCFGASLQDFRQDSFVNYIEEMQARRSVLELLAANLFKQQGHRRERFQAFLKSRPEAHDYARFRAACESARSGWPTWEPRMRDGELGAVDENIARYHLYSQWIAQEQVEAFTRDPANAEFYLDLPLGVHPNSYDVWRERESFALRASVGAPPDQFFSKGQNWGFAPPHPLKMRVLHYSYLRRVLQFQMRHTGLLRIDHIMALHRLFWVPRGGSAPDGVYVRYPAEELSALLCLESHRNKTVIIGENLGTVPPEVNKLIRRHGFRGMHVLQFSLRPGTNPITTPDPPVLTSLGTHDTATFTAFWEGKDISDRLDLGLITPKQAHAERKLRAQTVQRLQKFLQRSGLLQRSKATTLDAIHACLRALANSRAEMMSIDLEDLFLETKPQNTPGTTDQRPNWRRKAKYSLEEIFQMRGIEKFLSEITQARAHPQVSRLEKPLRKKQLVLV